MSSILAIWKSFTEYVVGFILTLLLLSMWTCFSSDEPRPPAPDPAFANVECCLILIVLLEFGHGLLLLSESVTGEFPPLRTILCLRPLDQIFKLEWQALLCAFAFLVVNYCQATANMDWMFPLIAICVRHLGSRPQNHVSDAQERRESPDSAYPPLEELFSPDVARVLTIIGKIFDDDWTFPFICYCASIFIFVADSPTFMDMGMACATAMAILVIFWYLDQSLLTMSSSARKPEPRISTQSALAKAYDIVVWSLLFSVVIAGVTLLDSTPDWSDVLLGVGSSFIWVLIFFGISLPLDLIRLPLWGYILAILVSEAMMTDLKQKWIRRVVGFAPTCTAGVERLISGSTSIRAFKWSVRVATLATCVVIWTRITLAMHPRLSHVDWTSKTWPPRNPRL